MKRRWRSGIILISALIGLHIYMRKAVLKGEFAPSAEQTVPLDDFLKQQGKYTRGVNAEYVKFQAQEADGSNRTHVRHGILYRNPQAKATILLCHGFMCNAFDVSFLRQTLFPTHNVLIFDFRAHGQGVENEHVCTFGRDEALDVIGAVDYVRNRQDLKTFPLFVYGFSMGAVAAIQAQSKKPLLFDGMILDCPYDRSENIIKRGLERLQFALCGYTFDMPGRSFLEAYAFNPYVQSLLKAAFKLVAQMDATGTNTFLYPVHPAESVRAIQVPCLFIHCRNDDKVPVAAAHALFGNASGYKRLWITNGRRHFDSFFYNPPKYAHKIDRFIGDVLSKRIEKKQKQKVSVDTPVQSVSPEQHVNV